MKLTQGERSSAHGAATASRKVKRFGLVVALGLATLVMTGCGPREVLRFGWPTGVTPEAKTMGHLWTWAVIASLIVGFMVWMAIFITITFHRHRDGQDSFPRQTAYNMPVELVLITLPFLAIAVLFYFTVVVENKVESKTDNPDVVVDVTAFQWNWKFGYDKIRQDDGSYKNYAVQGSPFDLQAQREVEHGHELPLPAGGRSDDIRDYLKFSKIETLGTPTEIPILVLPVGKRIEFNLAAADVVHSFWVPEFLYKRDVMPFPKQNHTDPRFQIEKIERPGAFVGRCAEMCGTYHAMMNFEIRVVSAEDFARYVALRENQGLTNAAALEAICQVPVSVTTVPFETRRATGGDTPKHLGDTWNTKLPNCTPRSTGVS
ncbi:MAG TPA: cytochrome c oxidase subunit II [Gordonia sp. (in: high G+C Gram-positive bacteria)]|uniref:aa3-type cytochrome oxidase subunit II n=1 Tax=unclassified Gordonia (in: high G+C Gram-positive bacteria) TaxID=2657482 RepID=UPI000F9499BC|nr:MULTISPECIES: cytochrome c oxidase subunit II [unclassified Gordonia (in: high G+C Gram-positive bacteria)]RTL09275.1 MAG: cytochrome c oxidase subunit II [Acidimicrobiia bacterium]HNP58648.1 cytochrome c oxidase subunit II [Gordonia sp. (in: high G+C Gram-positive bacteria)]HRC52331.1 cytochrome c oxidase subunit II [Gordonia sp. (in: high G+C Gram-positive bacteria)]